jgi:membrane-associated protease RseP (regulator of RpoE activity)
MNQTWKSWVPHVVLFVLTFLTAYLVQGPLYAVTIMAILLAHESGHYFMCRRYGVQATFPLFIPMPNILGTMGAVIAMKSPMPNRKALFDIGVAGPLAGLAVAIPAILIGLHYSTVETLPKEGVHLYLGEPLLFQWLATHVFGTLPKDHDLFLHPIAFAGWAALFVTSINLFPAGQLDGGHVMFAMLGPRAKYVSWLVAAALCYLGFAYQPMWFIFTVLIFLFMFRHPSPIDPVTQLDRKRIVIGVLTFALQVICFVPIPFELRT